MPSSIQTSPPAMHRRSLHPNRIYPAINGLDPAKVRFATQYQDKTYYVGEVVKGDNTLRILAVLNGLLNLNRDANAIPKTPAVQAIGG